jgi:hypothetical protein
MERDGLDGDSFIAPSGRRIRSYGTDKKGLAHAASWYVPAGYEKPPGVPLSIAEYVALPELDDGIGRGKL